MSFDIGAIMGTLVLDSNKWDKAIDRAKKDAKSFEGAILRNERRVKQFGLALGVAGAAITAMNVKLVQLAAGAEESENLFEVSMGKMADSAREWSVELSRSLGLNQFEIRKSVGVLNVMLREMGIAEDAAYDMSKSLVQLSQDMASFFNISSEEAFMKIRSGITGETEPLKRLGIIVNEITVKNFALTKGIIKQGEVLTEQQKIMARYGVITAATTKAQGDLARTINSTTNQARIFTSRVTELGISLGQHLLPATNAVLQILNKIVEILQILADRFPNATAGVIGFSAAMGILMTVAGGILLILPGLAKAAIAMGTTMGAVATGLALSFFQWSVAVGAVVIALNNLQTIKNWFSALSVGINKIIADALLSMIKFVDFMSELTGITSRSFEQVRGEILKTAVGFNKNADLMLQDMIDNMEKAAGSSNEFNIKVTADIEKVGDEFSKMWDLASKDAKDAFNKMDKDSKTWFQKMVDEFNFFEEMGKRTFGALTDGISDLFFDVMTGEIKSLQDIFADFGKSVIRIIADIIAQWIAMKIITGIIGTAATAGVGGYGAGTPAGVRDMGSFSTLPSFDSGISNVPFDMIAKIHKGERVVTAEENEGGEGRILEIHNHITPEVVAMAMNAREGKDVIINVISRNAIASGPVRKRILER